MLGQNVVNAPKTSSKTLNSIENSIQKDINKAASDIAKAINIHDFYSVHVLDFCEVGCVLSPSHSSTTRRSLTLTKSVPIGLLYAFAYRQRLFRSG
jgi:hypothetical protein